MQIQTRPPAPPGLAVHRNTDNTRSHQQHPSKHQRSAAPAGVSESHARDFPPNTPQTHRGRSMQIQARPPAPPDHTAPPIPPPLPGNFRHHHNQRYGSQNHPRQQGRGAAAPHTVFKSHIANTGRDTPPQAPPLTTPTSGPSQSPAR
jgi:hypothetical protein